jgi:BlaI family transcriptional regulator, penicillinase repressor
MPKPPAQNLTAAQLEIMDLVWEHGELGVAQVWKLLAERRAVARNTVQTMLMRLVDKGWLRTRTEANAHLYRPARLRKAAVSRLVGDLVDKAFAGSASGLVMALLENRRLSPEEIRRIRDLINRAQREERLP